MLHKCLSSRSQCDVPEQLLAEALLKKVYSENKFFNPQKDLQWKQCHKIQKTCIAKKKRISFLASTNNFAVKHRQQPKLQAFLDPKPKFLSTNTYDTDVAAHCSLQLHTAQVQNPANEDGLVNELEGVAPLTDVNLSGRGRRWKNILSHLEL